MDINIIAAMEAAELVLERMSLEKGGRGGLLVNTASLAGVSFLSLSTSSLQVNCLCLSCQHYSSCIFGDSSVAGIAHGWKQDLHSYFASKHAVVSMTRTLGSDNVFKETGVKVHLHLFILRCNCFQYWELVPSNITYIPYQQCHQSSASLAIPLKSSPPPQLSSFLLVTLFTQVQCLCPSFADTAILNDKDGGKTNRDMLEKTYGILTVEEVSEGFMQLVENCGNGAAVIVFKVISLLSIAEHLNCP